MKASQKLLPLFLLLLLTGISCSRKGDESLPPRLGNLVVQFIVYEESDLIPDTSNIPVILDLYRDADLEQLVRSVDVSVSSGVLESTLMEDLPPQNYYLQLLINLPNLPEPCQAVAVAVQLNQTTYSPLLVYKVRESLMICPNPFGG